MKPKLNSKQIETKSKTQTVRVNVEAKRKRKAKRLVSRLLAAHTKGYPEVHIVAAPPEGLLALSAAAFPATRQVARRVVGPLVSPWVAQRRFSYPYLELVQPLNRLHPRKSPRVAYEIRVQSDLNREK